MRAAPQGTWFGVDGFVPRAQAAMVAAAKATGGAKVELSSRYHVWLSDEVAVAVGNPQLRR